MCIMWWIGIILFCFIKLEVSGFQVAVRKWAVEKREFHALRAFQTSAEMLSNLTSKTSSLDNSKQSQTPNNFGDIMNAFETSCVLPGEFNPMERVVLTANGNLQRILSAYYGAPVKVQVRKCVRIDKSNFDREVDLLLGDKIICSVIGKIEVRDEKCLQAIEQELVGVGQLFRYLSILPTFALHEAGRYPERFPSSRLMDLLKRERRENDEEQYSLWRDYELSCPQLTCHFIERFARDFLDDSSISKAKQK